MQNKNLIRFVQSLLFLPVISMPLALSSIYGVETSRNVLVQKVNIVADGTPILNTEVDLRALELNAKADAIDAYFRAQDMPLEGMGMKMVLEAEKNEIDWRLLPAIAVRESTGGKNACDYAENNSFGWASCKIGFESNEEAIEIVAMNLGGNNPKTAYRYDNKTVTEILRVYNPPSIIPKYAEQVLGIMDKIGDAELTTTSSLAVVNS